MDAARRQLIKDFKERKVARGVYQVRAGSGERWVGASRNLGATRNSLWFGLKMGSYIDGGLQAAWTAAGGEGFEYEVMEELDEDVEELLVKDQLKAMRERWAAKLGARTLR
jgi:hypothetical protein